jgi:DNA-binding NarL/FixJ family response regulator
MILNLLCIEDYDKVRDQIVEYFHKTEIESHKLLIEAVGDFDSGINNIKENEYDIILLDLCKGKPSDDNLERPGLDALETIRKYTFCPVIFYTGIAHAIKDLESTIVGVVSKSDGLEKLEQVITRIIRSNLGLIKQKTTIHIRESLRDFFWEIVHKEKDLFTKIEDEVSLGYLMLRRISASLSKDKIKNLLNDDKIKINKAHPMEFYIYPTDLKEYCTGEILSKDNLYYIILTPLCDFIEDETRKRKAEYVLLATCEILENSELYKKYLTNKNSDNKKRLQKLIESRGSDQFFFLPKTPFLKNHLILNFQKKTMVKYSDLSQFQRLARLDSPFAESMISSFIRYYNRVGFPDIDSEYILETINKTLES